MIKYLLLLTLLSSMMFADNSALITAAKNKDTAKFNSLLKSGADINAKNTDGNTALDEAQDAEEVKTIKTLKALALR